MENDSDSDVGDILNDLLANDDTEESQEPPQKQTLKELDFNFLDSESKPNDETKPASPQEKSAVYNDALDSSDDEDRRCFEEQKYSDYGRDIKTLLKNDTSKSNEDRLPFHGKSSKTFDFNAPKDDRNANSKINNAPVNNMSKDVYSDPFFGLRIVNPVISSTELKSRMCEKIPVTVSRIKHHLNSERLEKDWVIAGVLINKSLPKTSQKGSLYSIWKLSDLSEDISTVCLFMFSSAYKTFWKTTVGTVIGVLNPNVLESKDSMDLGTLSIDNPQKIMVLGKSKDMGKCRSKKKNGDPCNSIVNLGRCEFCLYHIKQEYKKCSSRSELQACSNTQKFSIDMMKQRSQQQRKPFQNNMPEFNAVVAVKNKKLEEKDAKRLALLSGTQKTDNSISSNVNALKDKQMKAEAAEQKMKQDFERVNNSRGWKATVLSQTSHDNAVSLSPKLLKSNSCKQNNTGKRDLSMLSSSPRLGAGCLSGTIDLSEPITNRQINSAKSNAIKWVKKNGEIKAKDPNRIRLSKEEKLDNGKKRLREPGDDKEQEAKKSKVLSDKFKEIMQTKSAHTDLIERSYEQEQEKYFNKLEIKERLEAKMLNTFKVPCKAVRCLKCKYTSFSASDMCKQQQHPLRVADAVKRFFKCGDCGSRTVSLDRMPSHSCIKCSSSNWTRAAMMDERKTNVSVTALSIRGDEEAHIGSLTKDANLNLLVPDKDYK